MALLIANGLFYSSFFFFNTPELNPLRAHTKLSSPLNANGTKLQVVLNYSSHVALTQACASPEALLIITQHTPLSILRGSN